MSNLNIPPITIPAISSINFVKATGSVSYANGSTNTNVTMTNASNNTLMVFTGTVEDVSNINSVTDTFGTTYTLKSSPFQFSPAIHTEIWTGKLNRSGQNTISVNWSNNFIDRFALVAEYSGVADVRLGISGSNSSSGLSGSMSLPVIDSTFLVAGGFTVGLTDFIINQQLGTIRFRLGVTGSIFDNIGACIIDTSGVTISAAWPNQKFWYASAIEMFAVPPVKQLPSAIFVDRTSPQDIKYPYPSIQVIPTSLPPLAFVCLKCQTPVSATIYRDVRENAIALGIPSPNRGGIQKGQRYDFIFCPSCTTWYRKNDYKIISNVSITDKLPSPLNDISGNTTTAFIDMDRYIGANISDDNIRQSFDAQTFGFTDEFEPTGILVIAMPAFFSFGAFDSSAFNSDFAPAGGTWY